MAGYGLLSGGFFRAKNTKGIANGPKAKPIASQKTRLAPRREAR
jgi:hypothetical protein